MIVYSERWIEHGTSRIAYERAMLADSGGTAADRRGRRGRRVPRCWTSPRNGWSYIQKVNNVSATVLDNWGNGGGNFTRTILFDKLEDVMTAAQVQEPCDSGQLIKSPDQVGFFIGRKPSSSEPDAATRNVPEQFLHAL